MLMVPLLATASSPWSSYRGYRFGDAPQLAGAGGELPGAVALVGRLTGRRDRNEGEPTIGTSVIDLQELTVLILPDQRIEGPEEHILPSALTPRSEADRVVVKPLFSVIVSSLAPVPGVINCGRPSVYS